MPSQQDQLLTRIAQTTSFIKAEQPVNMEKVEAWGLTVLGVRPRTIREYISALLIMDMIFMKGDVVSFEKTLVSEG